MLLIKELRIHLQKQSLRKAVRNDLYHKPYSIFPIDEAEPIGLLQCDWKR